MDGGEEAMRMARPRSMKMGTTRSPCPMMLEPAAGFNRQFCDGLRFRTTLLCRSASEAAHSVTEQRSSASSARAPCLAAAPR
jgi:hypothetical protein